MGEQLSDSSHRALLELAREAIECRLYNKNPSSPPPDNEELHLRRGVFVSLHTKNGLRGCIGLFEGEKPLYLTVREMALCSAFDDPRFPPLREKELDEIDIEISVLSPLRRVEDPNEIQVGTHGIYIIKGFNRGVLLPQVAVEQGWDRSEFLDHTCIKAGLAPGDWKRGVELYVFTADVFGENHGPRHPS